MDKAFGVEDSRKRILDRRGMRDKMTAFLLRWVLFLLGVLLLLTLSCSQGTSPFQPVPDASLFFNLSGTPKYVVNGGSGTAYEVHLYRCINTLVDNFANPDSLISQERYGFTVGPYDSLVATWKNPNGTPGRVKGI